MQHIGIVQDQIPGLAAVFPPINDMDATPFIHQPDFRNVSMAMDRAYLSTVVNFGIGQISDTRPGLSGAVPAPPELHAYGSLQSLQNHKIYLLRHYSTQAARYLLIFAPSSRKIC